MDEDVPRYKKKAKKKSPKKANHKHRFENCVLGYNTIALDKAHGVVPSPELSIGTYCPACGKIGVHTDSAWRVKKNDPNLPAKAMRQTQWSDEAKREFDPHTRTLPYFWLDDWLQKYTRLEQEGAK